MAHVGYGDKVRKAVFPVADMGSWFRPATKASPKEVMAVVDKPLIQSAVEEAIDAGVTKMIFFTGRTKRSIADHFDKAYELEHQLGLHGKTGLLANSQNIVSKGISCTYIRQTEEQVLAFEYEGIRYDCGSKLGLIKANIDLGLRHQEIGDELRTYLKNELLAKL